MKKQLINMIMASILVAGAAVAAQNADQVGGRGLRRSSEGMRAESVTGEIRTVSVDGLTIVIGQAEDAKTIEVGLPRSDSQAYRELLAQGIGNKAELLCYKRPNGALRLVRIKSIEGVDVSSQPAAWPRIREGIRQRAQSFTPEQKQAMKALHERLQSDPELREELQGLHREDRDAFRDRIHELLAEAGLAPEDMPQMGPGGPHGFAGATPRGPGGPGGFGPNPHQMPGVGQAPPFGPAGQGQSRFGTGPRGSAGQPGMMGSPMMPGMARIPGTPGFGRRGQNPEITKLERQSYQLAQKYRRAEGKEKDELAEKLRDTLAQVFKLKAQVHEKEVERLEKQLDRLRQRLAKRQESSEDIIQKRFEQLTGREDSDLL